MYKINIITLVCRTKNSKIYDNSNGDNPNNLLYNKMRKTGNETCISISICYAKNTQQDA